MTTSTRGPGTGKVPPHIQDRLAAKRARAERRELLGPWYRRAPFVGVVAALIGLSAGIAIGRVTAPDPLAAAADELGSLALAVEQSAMIWESGLPTGERSVQSGLTTLRDGDPSVVTEHLDTWLRAYGQAIAALEAAEVSPAADGARQLFVAAAELSRDATETVGAAAAVDADAREVLLIEAERIRARAVTYADAGQRVLQRLQGEDLRSEPSPATAPELPRPAAVTEEDGAEPEPTTAGS